MPFGELLEQNRIGLTLVTLHRERLTATQIMGVIRQFSKQLVLVEGFAESGQGTGFIIVRREDLTRLDARTEGLRQTLQKAGMITRLHPMTREVDLADWRTTLETASLITPSIRLHREGTGESIFLASRTIKIFKHVLSGERPDPEPADEGELAVVLDHLTRIDLA